MHTYADMQPTVKVSTIQGTKMNVRIDLEYTVFNAGWDRMLETLGPHF